MGRLCWTAALCTMLAAGCRTSDPGEARQADWRRVCACLAPSTPTDLCSAPNAALAQRLSALAGVARASVVTIAVQRRDSAAAGTSLAGAIDGGSGFAIAPGWILTCEHVVRGAGDIRVLTPDGRGCRPRSVHVLTGRDLALLEIPDLGRRSIPALTLAETSGPLRRVAGSGVVLIGAPPTHDGPAIARAGVVIGSASMQARLDPAGTRDYSHMIESTAPAEPGCSGGPILDETGRVVGVAAAADTTARRSYALPLDAATVHEISRYTRDKP